MVKLKKPMPSQEAIWFVYEQLGHIPENRDIWDTLKYLNYQPNKQDAWVYFERDQKLAEERYLAGIYHPTLEEAFDLDDVRCILHTWNEDHANHMECKRVEKIERQRLEYHFEEHHLLSENETPYWKECVEKIEEALKKTS